MAKALQGRIEKERRSFGSTRELERLAGTGTGTAELSEMLGQTIAVGGREGIIRAVEISVLDWGGVFADIDIQWLDEPVP